MLVPLPLPEFPGVQLRHYERPNDVLDFLAVHAACVERDRLDPHSVCNRLPFLSPEKYVEQITLPDATLVAETDGEVVAHGFMEAWGVDERLYLWQVWVRPDFRGRGLGTVMHRWGEVKARAMHESDTRLAFHLANTTEGEADAAELLRTEGYHLGFVSPELAFDIADTLPAPTPPNGVALRSLDRKDTLVVARALSEANLNIAHFTRQALEDRLTAQAEEWNERVRESNPALSVVAWDGDQVAGAYLCRRAGNVGEISQVAVRDRWRNRGIARALAMQSLHNLRSSGCVTARLFTSVGSDETEPANGPYAMYRKFGFYPIARHLRFRKPMTLSSMY